MGNDIVFAFGMFQMTLLLLDGFILAKTGRDIARQGEYVWFCLLVVTHMVYLLANSLWTLGEYGMLSMPRDAQLAACTISMLSVTNTALASLSCSAWLSRSAAT